MPQPAIRTAAAISDSRPVFMARTVAIRWAAMASEPSAFGLPMTTAFELPGARVAENLGVCYGLVVRSMGFTGGVTASFRALRRGEIPEYTQLLEDSRRHAIDRMV